MQIKQRPFSGEADKQKMSTLVYAFPTDNLHVADLPYRFSSWAFDDPENVALWTDEQGQLTAWGVLQTPFWAIDYAYHPHAQPDMHRRILAWADHRARQIVNRPGGRPSWFVHVFARQVDRIRDLEEMGFSSQANVGENSWSKVLMARPAETPVEEHMLPDGFTLRALAGTSEVEAYVALHQATFESKNMTFAWRANTLRRPGYRPDLDLVAVAPDGSLGGFCICWLKEGGSHASVGQIEPLGVRQELRGLGLGRALLLEGLRRLRSHGAARVLVETDNYRDDAFRLYESVGFRVIEDVLVYRRDYGSLD